MQKSLLISAIGRAAKHPTFYLATIVFLVAYLSSTIIGDSFSVWEFLIVTSIYAACMFSAATFGSYFYLRRQRV